MSEKAINASAGQTALSPRALRAITHPLNSPIYYPDYLEAELKANHLLRKLIGTKSDVLLVTGNATLGIEASLLSLFEPGDSLVIVNGGVFGQVLVELAILLGLSPIELRVPYGAALELEQLERIVMENPQARAVAVVHVETSTGVQYPIDEIALFTTAHNRLLLVDAVSSLGAIEFKMDAWAVDICIGSGQKALNAPQGLALVAVSPRAWDHISRRSMPIPSVCLDLNVWRQFRENDVIALHQVYKGSGSRSSHLGKIIHGPSPPASLVYALVGALEDIFEEGLERVYARHKVAAEAVRRGVEALGLQVLSAEEIACPVVTTVLLPEDINETQLRIEILEREQIALGWGPSELGLHCTRIGSMGRAAHPHVQITVIRALGQALQRAGHACKPQDGMDAAQSVFAEVQDRSLWLNE